MNQERDPVTDPVADLAFERLLLRSASADALPDTATREAWTKFANASAGVALVATTPGLGSALHAARRTSLKWLALGAIGGSALTAALMGTRSAQTSTVVTPPSLSSAALASAPPPLSISAPAPSLAPPTAREPRAAREAESPSSWREKAASARPSQATQLARSTQSSASSLAAEVAALDSVQRAITSADFSRALRLVEAYHREFPQGQLAPDADALAIEAMAAQGNRAELALRAARFLTRYPKDPHAARIATLVEP